LKTLVSNKLQNTRIPFLRGILIGSLQDAGMSFNEAYKLATWVRNDLGDRSEITTEELRELVGSRLRRLADGKILEQYSALQAAPARITVCSLSNKESPFSRDRHQRYLLSSGLRMEPAEHITELVYDQLLTAGIDSITTCQLGYLTWLCLRQEIGSKAASRYLIWSEFQRSGQPLILLFGGAVGTGKSTLATEVAHQLEIVRVQSTDMLREVMRMMIPERLMPVLHCSSFEAWKALPARDVVDRDQDQLVAEGYRTQAELLAVSCEAVMQRALEEGVPVIVEGVHAHPDIGLSMAREKDAIVVSIMLAVLNSDELRNRLRGRGSEEPQRNTDSYLDSFDSIWRLQSYLLSEADRCDVPIVANDDRDRAKKEITRTIINTLSSRFSGSPAEVFGDVVSAGKEPGWRRFMMRLVA
jgi:2-phosphoglycerate kinase